MLAKSPPDAVILDIGMPRLDGLEVCRRMRQAGDRTPILMLTARDAIDDRVEGLDVGADDYLVKPFALRELQARLRALLRRSGDGADGEILRYADMVLDPIAHEVRRGDRVIELSKTEFLLLELFMRHPRQVLTRSTIFENVWGYDFGPTSNALGVYMGYLRRKTEAGSEPRLLHTVRGSRLRAAGLSRVATQETVPGGRLGRRAGSRHRRDRLLHGGAQPAARRGGLASSRRRRQPSRTDRHRSVRRLRARPPATEGRPSTTSWSASTGRPTATSGCRSPGACRRLPRARLRRSSRTSRSAEAASASSRSSPICDQGIEVVPGAVQLARPLEPIANILRKLRLVLLLVCAGGIALAALLGRLAARQRARAAGRGGGDRAAHRGDRGPLEPDPRPRRRRGRASSPPASTR